MKIVLSSLLCLILIGFSSYSYAQSEWIIPNRTTILPAEVMLQLEVRDSNGNLVSYVESEQIIGFRYLELNSFFDNLNQTHKEFFIKDDKKYEILQWETSRDTFPARLAYSVHSILDIYQNEFIKLLVMRIDAYQTQPGDTLRTFWTVIRPAS